MIDDDFVSDEDKRALDILDNLDEPSLELLLDISDPTEQNNLLKREEKELAYS